jgi:outer membrane receptor protein involved in Fe transport
VLTDGGRSAGAVYAYDEWAVTPKVTLNYGARLARYDYLADRSLLSPRASITLTPTSDDTFKLRAAASRRLSAPGAEEFMPPTMGVWVPPERTFSALSPRGALTPQRLDHVELAIERAWAGDVVIGVRGFRQDVDDQLVTLFGAASRTSTGGLSHYYVASAGDVDARGWTISVSHTANEHIKASVDYSRVYALWAAPAGDAVLPSALAIVAPRTDRESFHDITSSVASTVPVTATRVFVLYKVNSHFANQGPARAPAARFDLQLTQALPFLTAGGAEWEMLVAVRNLFREELLDTSVYDEIFVVRPPKRVVGGVTVRF